MPHLNEANLLLACAEGFHNAVDAISGEPEDDVYAPIQKAFD
jgi:hypothetical protein